LKEAVVVNPTEPVPCNRFEFKAKLAVPDNEPVTVRVPWTFAFPVTVKDPVMYGELSIIYFVITIF
jgi:hypothetical protein